MKLRQYQIDSITQLRQAISQGFKRPVLQLPTGAGKTVIMAEIVKMARSKGKKVCVFMDRITLVNQTSAVFDEMGINHGIIQADNPRHNLEMPVQIASIQSYSRRNHRWDFDLGLIDEAHCLYKAQTDLIERWGLVPFIGVTATPFTKGMGNVYDKLINTVTLNDLIEQGFLVPADVYGPSQPDMKGVGGGDDFNQKQTAERAQEPALIASIVQTWHKLAQNKQTICFATNVCHSKYIVEEFVKSGVNARHIDAYTDSQERFQIIQGFKNGEIKLLSSVGVLTTGFDAPNAEVEIMARPTKSLALFCQMAGRVLRPNEGKDRALILDHAGNFERMGFHTDDMPQELCTKKKGESKREKPIVLPKACPKCKVMKPVKAAICPQCGFETKAQNQIFEEAGELEKIKQAERDKKKINREYTREEKEKFLGGLLTFAERKGYKRGWAANKYREKFGVWPNAIDEVMCEPNEMVTKFIQYCNIKWAKSQGVKT